MKIISFVGAIGSLSMSPDPGFPTTVEIWSHIHHLPWNWNPWILGNLVLALFGFVRGLISLGTKSRRRLFPWTRCASFAAGIAALFFALISPFDALDDQLLSAHMLQHLILLLVAPPLLLSGRPVVAWIWAFPLTARRAISRVWLRSGLPKAFHAAMSPWAVFALASAALWFWHLPRPYGWALSSDVVHALEHLCFFTTSLMFWSLILQPLGRSRLSYGARILFVAVFGLEMGFLGALLTFAGRSFYAAYLPTAPAWGLTPLEDQQLSGLIMWVPAGFIHLAALGVLFVAWMRSAEYQARKIVTERSATQVRNAAASIALIACLMISGLAGCGAAPAEPRWKIVNANARRGRGLVETYGCGSCHVIPGVPNAVGHVGPPLEDFGQRVYIAGLLQNSPDNLVKWLRNPQSVVPGNAMPNMHITEQDARDLAAYLYVPSKR